MFLNCVCISINHIAALAEIVCYASVPQPHLRKFSPAATASNVARLTLITVLDVVQNTEKYTYQSVYSFPLNILFLCQKIFKNSCDAKMC